MRARSTLLGALLLAACAKSTAYQAPPPHPQPDHPITQADPEPNELPAHHFYARPSNARAWPTPQAVAFRSLPAMVQSRKCVNAGAIPEGRPSTTAKPKRTKKKGSTPGFVPYAGNTTSPAETKAKQDRGAEVDASAADGDDRVIAKNDTSAPRSTPPTSMPASEEMAPEPEPARRAPAGDVAVASGGDWGEGESVDARESQSAPADLEMASRNRGSKRKARRSRRKAKRAHDRAMAAASSPASMPEPTPAQAQAEAPLIQAQPEPEPLVWPAPEEGWGAATYLSNDDTMSLSSAQRVLFAIDEHLPLPPQHVRPHELLNYFSFATDPVSPEHDFSVRAELAPSSRDPGMVSLGLAIASRPMGREGRRNASLTLVIDRSGSMRAEGRMEYLKRGLLRMARELKDGDIVHVVTFDQRVCNPLRNFVVGRDPLSALTQTIHAIKPSGSTNMHAGLNQGYQLADATYQAGYTNRVIVVTDALANKGVTDARTMAMVSDWYDARRIRLSGIGVGREFNDALLDRLTEKGRGAYVFLGSEAEVDAVFGSHFTSLIETAANDVHFRLHLPPTLRMEQFHGEESSTVKADVQAVHFFADTSQLMLADLQPWEGAVRPQDDIMLEIEYQDPETGELRTEDHVFNLGEIGERDDNVRKGELVMHFVEGISRQAQRGAPAGWKPRPGSWLDAAALEDCGQTRAELRQMAAGSRDPEVGRVLSLWDGYCARFEGSARGRPSRKGNGDRWPSAGR